MYERKWNLKKVAYRHQTLKKRYEGDCQWEFGPSSQQTCGFCAACKLAHFPAKLLAGFHKFRTVFLLVPLTFQHIKRAEKTQIIIIWLSRLILTHGNRGNGWCLGIGVCYNMCVAVDSVSCAFTTQFRGEFLKTGNYKDNLSFAILQYSLTTHTTKYIFRVNSNVISWSRRSCQSWLNKSSSSPCVISFKKIATQPFFKCFR